MRRIRWLVPALGLASLFGLARLLGDRAIPLGIPGEWEWSRIPRGIVPSPLLPPSLALLGYVGLVTAGFRALDRPTGRLREIASVLGLVLAAIGVQWAIHRAAPVGYGLEKWVTLANSGSSGYLGVAIREADPLGRFLARYPEWIRRQDALHIGTHPPGLFVTSRWAYDLASRDPGLARMVIRNAPGGVEEALSRLLPASGLPERAAVVVLGWATLLACSATVVPLYLLARKGLPAARAWSVAAAWPLVPSAVLFQPTADTAFPLLSAGAIACAAWAGSSRSRLALAATSGVLLALGMQFTLAFLAVGLLVALVIVTSEGDGQFPRLRALLVVGVGFLAATGLWWRWTGADPLPIWWANQANHARFYAEYPRSYRAWVLVNPLETAIFLGLPMTPWMLVGLREPRPSRITWFTWLVLGLLTLSGRNLSEVGRLWLPFFPGLLVASGAGMARAEAGPAGLAATLALLGIQTILMQRMIQVVYPF